MKVHGGAHHRAPSRTRPPAHSGADAVPGALHGVAVPQGSSSSSRDSKFSDSTVAASMVCEQPVRKSRRSECGRSVASAAHLLVLPVRLSALLHVLHSRSQSLRPLTSIAADAR